MRPQAATEVHHIWQGHPRYDLTSNLIALSAEAHRWCHENQVDGRVTCLWLKMQKAELDPAEFRQASGWYLEGWLSGRECETDSGERRRAELLAWVQQLSEAGTTER